jgi:4-aminobutyrate aminotransferase-like enzyme
MRDDDTTARVVARCLERGVLLGWTLHSHRLIRIAPPLNIEWNVVDEACAVIREAMDAVGEHSK